MDEIQAETQAQTQKSDPLVDATDCLEAGKTFKSVRLFFFTLIILCLLCQQGIFWAHWLGYIKDSGNAVQCDGNRCKISGIIPLQAETPAMEETQEAEEVSALVSDVSKEAEQVAEQLQVEAEEMDTPIQLPDEVVNESMGTAVKTEKGKKFTLSQNRVSRIIILCNYILLISAIMYSLVLCMSIHVSLVGRLGGVEHISKAFFCSLFALVLLLPWQSTFPGVLCGGIYTPMELFNGCSVKGQECKIMGMVLMMGRYVGIWLIILLSYISSQVRAAKWYHATNRRLGIVKA